MQAALLLRIDAADADLPDRAALHRRRRAGQRGQRCGTVSAQAGHRHAMHVAGRRGGADIGVGVRVEPQHHQGLAGVTAMARRGADRADRQAMVATHQQRQPTRLQGAEAGVIDRTVPRQHFVEVTQAVPGRLPRIGGAVEVAGVLDLQFVAIQRLRQAGDAQRLRAHRAAARAGPDVGRGANQRDRFHGKDAVSADASMRLQVSYPPPRGRSSAQRRRLPLDVPVIFIGIAYANRPIFPMYEEFSLQLPGERRRGDNGCVFAVIRRRVLCAAFHFDLPFTPAGYHMNVWHDCSWSATCLQSRS
ncbi:hypothetical protein CBM2609_B70265 [Cupriavidus taiwanensis]|nr:hypothetical protein CBM2609_B70265 [Cupriavidus taiwanensis]SOZ48636.1 hypothetical protein CBM2610_B50265 [Cupriavidus taiwanensis]